MSLWRKFLKTLNLEMYDFNIYTDGSPQWRGLEMLATSFDLTGPDYYVRRLMPLISLERYQLTLVGKIIAILWQFFLIVGPSYVLFRMVLRRIRSFTVDQGTERLTADHRDVLHDFLDWLHIRIPPSARTSMPLYLFPRALIMTGWFHIWDTLLRRGLCACDFFPGFIGKLKGALGFLRMETIRNEIVRRLKDSGKQGLAMVFEATPFQYFARWRWGTLQKACTDMVRYRESLTESFDKTWFSNSKDQTGLANLCSLLYNARSQNASCGSQSGFVTGCVRSRRVWEAANAIQQTLPMVSTLSVARKVDDWEKLGRTFEAS
jgi:hypothetical protein